MADAIEQNPKIRMAIDHGLIAYERAESTLVQSDGEPFVTAARIEPLVKPGEIWCTEAFKIMLNKSEGRYKAMKIKKAEAPHIPFKNRMFNVRKEKKEGGEEDILLKLYRIQEK